MKAHPHSRGGGERAHTASRRSGVIYYMLFPPNLWKEMDLSLLTAVHPCTLKARLGPRHRFRPMPMTGYFPVRVSVSCTDGKLPGDRLTQLSPSSGRGPTFACRVFA